LSGLVSPRLIGTILFLRGIFNRLNFDFPQWVASRAAPT
jgi:hypothetical protein